MIKTSGSKVSCDMGQEQQRLISPRLEGLTSAVVRRGAERVTVSNGDGVESEIPRADGALHMIFDPLRRVNVWTVV